MVQLNRTRHLLIISYHFSSSLSSAVVLDVLAQIVYEAIDFGHEILSSHILSESMA